MAATLAALAGTAAAAAYLDAKHHIRADLQKGSLDNAAAEAQQFIEERMAKNEGTMYHDIQNWAKQDIPNHQFLEYQGRNWTYKQFYQDLQRVGNWLMNDLGIQRNEMVALSGSNSAEYLMLWFAMDGIGACQSFVNHNLTGKALEHCIKLCECRYVLADRETSERLEPCREDLEKAGVKIVYYDEALIAGLRDTTLIPAARTMGMQSADTRYLIYTSGTTGLPKGVMMLNGRSINTGRGMAKYLQLKQGDRFYTCLPLYHGAAQGLCTTPVIHAGAAMTLGKKFSHKTFWNEVHASKANRLQYVGELCRYLINAPPHPLEAAHNVHEAWGNGMRPDVWERFRQRFQIPLIHELYAATDGLGATFNRNYGEFSRSCIGVRGLLWKRAMADKEVHVRIDPDTEEVVKDKDGWVVRCGVNEPGEVFHAVDPATAEQVFKGYYKNQGASDKRWMRNVFKKGDLWFRSGDVHRQDADGRVFFVDRLGDTFRWKSENVSTNEVADVLGQFEQIAEANVYGVAVPNADGRCGCATIVLKEGLMLENLDCNGLGKFVHDRLPRYAVPYFLRVAPQLSYTGTFKIQKGQAKREGVDPDLIEKSGSKDKVYWMPPGSTAFVPYGRDDWEALKTGKVKL
ncbi:Putative AMP-dependent synthetase/ligase, AMP-binding, AMP-binding enzyme domain, ANL [Septoria linicola]|uniref:Very long-chain fatty acid transport protein n=1 Tax=Septoria linicola TaxID=215465 RepID=A0A9Q9B2D9_9PEZI|nr:putative AMP-dependent synthetase/ligase, AMP-binding, AMP-binding enzyme domain, ANL [Septoria linicola]USW57668.1 Putative AMP-dependent synthetase/ligase, AMP-binding, AMP-binding enzyme domain, ANL [Septoria linicola]